MMKLFLGVRKRSLKPTLATLIYPDTINQEQPVRNTTVNRT
jgi:hypothetical protein